MKSIRFRWLTVAIALVMSGCSALHSESSAARYVYEQHGVPVFVRIEPIEGGAKDNDQPASVSTEQVREALSGVRQNAAAFSTGGLVFSAGEMNELASPLALALSQAHADQDVAFAVLGRQRGLLGERTPPKVTTARVFVRDGRLNVIFGLVGAAYHDAYGLPTTRNIQIGERSGRVQYGWTVEARGASQVDQRGDWLAFDLAKLEQKAATTQVEGNSTSAGASAAAGGAGATSEGASSAEAARYARIAARLRVLDRLRANGLISQQEYRQRREAILDSI